MINVISTNITSPLGFTTEQNYKAVLGGASALRRQEGLWGLQEPFAASLFSEEQDAALAISGYTRFESLAIRSVREALSHTQLDVASPRVVLIVSTTKGNIGQSPSEAAQTIAEAIGLTTKPIVVCNACVSGLSAQLLADDLLSASLYDYAIVVGAEVQGKFIVSGFLSLKAVSDEPCRPFDIERYGLNPGEAAATIIFASHLLPCGEKAAQDVFHPGGSEGAASWHLVRGASRNDAFHNVSPSPVGDGLSGAIDAAMQGEDKAQLATVCVHGTATLYNDQMEAKAIRRSGLSDVPLSALKGYYGHTMGAAGVLETILTMRATDDGIVLPSKGFTELGVSEKVCIAGESRKTEKTAFLKLISGFGGCNVAALYERTRDEGQETRDEGQGTRDKGQETRVEGQETRVEGRGTRDKGQLAIDDDFCRTQRVQRVSTVRISSEDGRSPAEIYKQQIGGYPKFYKMDLLSRLAFVAAELLAPLTPEGEGLDRGSVILFNHSSSIVSDRQFLATINGKEGAFASPSVFVYTLPNIAAGEIAIRHHICGETAFYILQEKDEALMQQILEASLSASGATCAVSGWVDAESDTSYACELSLYKVSLNDKG